MKFKRCCNNSMVTLSNVSLKRAQILNFIQFNALRDPSIDGDTPFQACQSPHQIYCQEVGNEPKTHVINGIKEIQHYFVWRDIEKTFRDSAGNKASRASQGFLLYFFMLIFSYIYIFPNIRYYIQFCSTPKPFKLGLPNTFVLL